MSSLLIAGGRTERPVFKRKLPFGATQHPVEGVGVFATQSVGSTSYSCGYHVYFHREGEEESVSGFLAFKLEMRADGTLYWTQRPEQTWGGSSRFTDAERAEALFVVDGLKFSDESGYMFQAHGCVEPLIREHEGKIDRLERAIETQTKLLLDPREPKTVFVPKEKAPDGKGYMRPIDLSDAADEVEYQQRRTMWRMNRQRDQDRLDALRCGEPLLRYEMMLRLRAAWRRWSDQRPNLGVPKAKRRPPPLIRHRLVDLLENARHAGGSVVDEINDAVD